MVSDPSVGGPRRPVVLLIDDEHLLVRSLRRHLGRYFDVVPAESVAEACERLAARNYDAILCDVMMPNGGAQRVYGTACKDKPELGPRFIFMTGGAFEREARSFLRGLPNRVVPKPLDLPLVVAAIREIAAG